MRALSCASAHLIGALAAVAIPVLLMPVRKRLAAKGEIVVLYRDDGHVAIGDGSGGGGGIGAIPGCLL